VTSRRAVKQRGVAHLQAQQQDPRPPPAGVLANFGLITLVATGEAAACVEAWAGACARSTARPWFLPDDVVVARRVQSIVRAGRGASHSSVLQLGVCERPGSNQPSSTCGELNEHCMSSSHTRLTALYHCQRELALPSRCLNYALDHKAVVTRVGLGRP
jgi:hypothetical protein